jgi:hypothetical protein
MDQAVRRGLSNPYDRPHGPARSGAPRRTRAGLTRMAVVAGVGGAATLGAGGAAWADTSTAVPVATDHIVVRPDCAPGKDPILHLDAVGATATHCVPGPAYRPRPTVDPLAGRQVVEVTGRAEAGVEPGCTVFDDSTGHRWTLAGPLRRLPENVLLTVTGVTAPDQLSYCMQGDVLQVRGVDLADGTEQPGTVPIATTDRIRADIVPQLPKAVPPGVQPACGPVVDGGKLPSVALCTR